jgi:hypothetical protein
MPSSLDRFEAHDWNTAAWFPQAPAETVTDLEKSLHKLDTEARLLAELFLIDKGGPEASALLLRMTGDDDEQVAAGAAQGLNSIADAPSAEAIIEAIPLRKYPVVRSSLYLTAARTGKKELLPAIRSLLQHESDGQALRDGQVAAILLGDSEERPQFMDRLRQANSRESLDLAEKLSLIGDPRLAKGLLPWLNNLAPVTRLGSDRNPRTLRMCDLAVWTAHRLGVKFPMPSESLTNFDQPTLAAAEAALREISGP